MLSITLSGDITINDNNMIIQCHSIQIAKVVERKMGKEVEKRGRKESELTRERESEWGGGVGRWGWVGES